MDQAERLRNIIKRQQYEPQTMPLKMARLITVTSGKGGVGKTSVSVNLAIQLARMGKRVVILDADFGLANIEIMLGIRPQFDELCIDPCIPADWKEFTASRIWRGVNYNITVQNPEGVMKGVKKVLLDGQETEKIPSFPAGETHSVMIVMGTK